jgi:hypothetical protein
MRKRLSLNCDHRFSAPGHSTIGKDVPHSAMWRSRRGAGEGGSFVRSFIAAGCLEQKHPVIRLADRCVCKSESREQRSLHVRVFAL